MDVNVKGYSLIELLIALMLTAVGLISTISLQATAKQQSLDATQRVIAMQLAQDMLARIQLNVTQRYNYQAVDYGLQAMPVTYSCVNENCSADQMTAYDKALWNNLLLGQGEFGRATGLALPRACIHIKSNALVTIVVSWRGSFKMNSAVQDVKACDLVDVDLPYRRHVAIRSYLSLS
ncbi:type IV pilus modification protein PilV [Algibacillus agarilyticus]|uniref:type IV pilus modification protein PilV n=1 Tax=Algibacillus agarilyticus TaxID=2234133 RepID=UPI000DCFA0C3|nr:type IV pilus modification protein PilV [Algibacillus agarilyticus]